MKIIKWIIMFGLAVILLSCVGSLQPLFEENDLVFEPELIGTWKSKESADNWSFEKTGTKEYLLTIHQVVYEGKESAKEFPGDWVSFRARLGRLGEYLFLDLFLEESERPVRNDYYYAHLIPIHTVARVWLEEDSLKIIFLDEDWISGAIDSGRIKLAHARTEDWLILTAPTKELQAFALKYGGDEKAFPPGAGELFHREK